MPIIDPIKETLNIIEEFLNKCLIDSLSECEYDIFEVQIEAFQDSAFNKRMITYFLKVLLVELAFLFDSLDEFELTFEEDDKYLGLLDNEIEKTKCASHIVDTYHSLVKDNNNILMKEETVRCLKNDVKDAIDYASSVSLEKYFNSLAFKMPISTRSAFHEQFDFSQFISNDFFFSSLYKNSSKMGTNLPLSFSAYVGFIFHKFQGKRMLLKHCENYIRKQIDGIIKNHGRDFDNIEKRYNVHCNIIDSMIYSEKMSSEPSSIIDLVLTDFLLNTGLHHRSFFSTINNELFSTLCDKISMLSILGNPFDDSYYNKSYKLLVLLYYFDTNLDDVADALDTLNTVGSDFSFNHKWILNYLDKLYRDRGEPLQAIFTALDIDNLYHNKHMSLYKLKNDLAQFIYKYDEPYINKEPGTISLRKGHDKNELLIIANLIHMAGFYRLIG